MKALFPILVLLMLASSPLRASPSVADDVKQGNYEEALTKLAKVDRKSDLYVWSLLETARIEYKREQWSDFFGIAYFARKILPVSTETEKIRLLEILALLRHCQESQATEVLQARPFPAEKNLKANFEVVSEFLHVPLSHNGQPKLVDHSKGPRGLFSGAQMWPAKNLELESLDPRRLKRKVKPACEGKGAL